MAIKLDDETRAKIDAIRAAQPQLEAFRQIESEEERIAFMKSQPLSLLIDFAYEQRELKRSLDALTKKANALFEELEFGIIKAMEAQGTETSPLTRAGGLLASCSVVEEEAQNVDPDKWPELYEWILEHEACYILQKRLSAVAVRELLTSGEDLPGVSTFTRKKLNLRAV